jgi:predicted dehydrogenase
VPAGSLDQLLDGFDLDGVLIATPHSTHRDLAVRAALASKHVFVDKPLTLTVAEADEVIAATDANDVVLQVGHNRRRQPANRRIRVMIDEGELGMVHSLQVHHSAPLLFNPSLPPWRRSRAENPVGGMAALGVHQVDTFQYMAGPIVRVGTMSTRLLPDGEIDDTSVISLEFESGALGQLLMSQAAGPIVDLAINGTEATARNLGDGEILTVQRRGSTDVEPVDLQQINTVEDELDEFCRAIKGEASPETDGRVARSIVAVLEAIVASAEQRSFVDVS